MNAPTKQWWRKELFGIPVLIAGEALFLAVLLHVALACVFKPMPEKPPQHLEGRRFTAMLCEGSLGKFQQNDLAYWLKYGDPTLFAKSDAEYGFSSFRNMQTKGNEMPESLPREENGKFAALVRESFATQAGRLSIPFSSALEQGKANAEAKEPLNFPVWLDASGRPVKGLAMRDPETLTTVGLFKPEADSVIISIPSPDGMDVPPEIRVWSSCGMPALDSAAVRCLAKKLEVLGDSAFKLKDGKGYFVVRWRDLASGVNNGGSAQ